MMLDDVVRGSVKRSAFIITPKNVICLCQQTFPQTVADLHIARRDVFQRKTEHADNDLLQRHDHPDINGLGPGDI